MFIRKLQHTDWDAIINQNIHCAVNDFTKAIMCAARAAIPTKVIQIKSASKPWMNKELKRNIRKRETLYKCAKRTQAEIDWNKWRLQRNYVTKLNKHLHSEYISAEVNKLVDNKQNPHKYFQKLSSLIGRKHAQPIPPLVNPDGETVTHDEDKAQLLNDYFASQTRLDVPAQHTFPNEARSVPALENMKVSEREVLDLLNSLDPSKSTGPDEIPTKILKLAAVLISERNDQTFQ